MPPGEREQLVIELRAERDQLQRELDATKAQLLQLAEAATEAARAGDWDESTQQAKILTGALDQATKRFGELETKQRTTLQGLERNGESAAGAVRQLDAEVEDVRQALDKVGRARGLEQLPKEADAAGKGLSRAAKFAAELSDETKRAGEQGSEAAKRIATAFENASRRLEDFGDSARIAEGLLEDLGQSPAENLTAANTEAERGVVLLAQLANVTKRLGEESGEGLGSFADNAAKGRQAIRELRDQLTTATDDTSPVLRRELLRLERQFNATFQTGKKRVVELEREMTAIEVDLRASQTGFFDLRDAVEQLTFQFPRLSKVVGGSVAAIGAFSASYTATREFVDKVKELTGLDLDEPFREFFDAVQGWASSVADAAREAEYLANARQFLIAKGIDFTNSEAGIRFAMDQVSDAARRQVEAMGRSREELDKLRGFSAKGVADEVRRLTEVWRVLRTDLQRDPELLQQYEDKLRELGEQADRLGSQLDSKLRAELAKVREEVERLNPDTYGELWEQLGGAGQKAVQQQLDLLTELGAALSTTLPDGTRYAQEVTTEQADLIVKAIDGVLAQVRELPTQQREAADGQVEQLQRVRAEYASLTTEAAEKMKELAAATVEAMKTAADEITAAFRQARDAAAGRTEEAAAAQARSIEEAQQALAALRAEEGGLRDLEFGGAVLTDEQRDRLDEIPSLIQGATAAVRELEAAAPVGYGAVTEAAGSVAAILKDLVTGSDSFREAVQQLPASAQDALGNVISTYGRLYNRQEATVSQLEEVASAVRSVFSGAGQDTEELDRLVGKLRGETETLSAAWQDLVTPQVLRDAAAAAKELGGEWITLTPLTENTRIKLSDVQREGESVYSTFKNLSGNIVRVGDEFIRLSESAGDVATTTRSAGEGAERLESGIRGAAAGAGDLARASGEAQQPVDDLGRAGADAGEQLDGARQNLAALGSADARAGVAEAATGVGAVADQASRLRGELEQVRSILSDIAGVDLSELAETLGELTEAAS
jgi:uncharacterized phage infection (PIP) family protein YhgE